MLLGGTVKIALFELVLGFAHGILGVAELFGIAGADVFEILLQFFEVFPNLLLAIAKRSVTFARLAAAVALGLLTVLALLTLLARLTLLAFLARLLRAASLIIALLAARVITLLLFLLLEGVVHELALLAGEIAQLVELLHRLLGFLVLLARFLAVASLHALHQFLQLGEHFFGVFA